MLWKTHQTKFYKYNSIFKVLNPNPAYYRWWNKLRISTTSMHKKLADVFSRNVAPTKIIMNYWGSEAHKKNGIVKITQYFILVSFLHTKNYKIIKGYNPHVSFLHTKNYKIIKGYNPHAASLLSTGKIRLWFNYSNMTIRRWSMSHSVNKIVTCFRFQ